MTSVTGLALIAPRAQFFKPMFPRPCIDYHIRAIIQTLQCAQLLKKPSAMLKLRAAAKTTLAYVSTRNLR